MISWIFAFLSLAQAELCQKWSEPKQIGTLSKELVETSGLVISRDFPNRFYHVNDSGSDSKFYITDGSGKITQVVGVKGVDFTDAEELAYGNCPDKNGSCIYIGDIGDNKKDRSEIKIYVIREAKYFPPKVDPIDVWTFIYPDKPHNAEAMALHPNGDLFIITKERKKKYEARPAHIFRTSIYSLYKELKHLGELDLPGLSPEKDTYEEIATGMSISPDGKKFLLLTYKNIWEFDMDFSHPNFKIVPSLQLKQQEAISYMPDGRSLVYTSESDSQMMQISCLK